MNARKKPGAVLAWSGAELAASLKSHQFIVRVDGERYTVEVTGETNEHGDLLTKVVVP